MLYSTCPSIQILTDRLSSFSDKDCNNFSHTVHPTPDFVQIEAPDDILGAVWTDATDDADGLPSESHLRIPFLNIHLMTA